MCKCPDSNTWSVPKPTRICCLDAEHACTPYNYAVWIRKCPNPAPVCCLITEHAKILDESCICPAIKKSDIDRSDTSCASHTKYMHCDKQSARSTNLASLSSTLHVYSNTVSCLAHISNRRGGFTAFWCRLKSRMCGLQIMKGSRLPRRRRTGWFCAHSCANQV